MVHVQGVADRADYGGRHADAAGDLAADPDLDQDDARLEEVLSSNICRCTGYVGIRRAAVAAACEMRAPGH
jgi:carbon-monoxide dehydrogenase small subunit